MRIPIESSTSYRGRHSQPRWLALLAFVALGFAVGGFGALFSPALSPTSALWYTALAKPGWAPTQPWISVVWSALYLAMGIAAWLVWRERFHRGRNHAVVAHAVQLLLNALWAPLFFGGRNITAALLVGVALWLAVLWTLREFAGVRILSAGLLLPYFVWVSFAVALNLEIWRHSP